MNILNFNIHKTLLFPVSSNSLKLLNKEILCTIPLWEPNYNTLKVYTSTIRAFLFPSLFRVASFSIMHTSPNIYHTPYSFHLKKRENVTKKNKWYQKCAINFLNISYFLDFFCNCAFFVKNNFFIAYLHMFWFTIYCESWF